MNEGLFSMACIQQRIVGSRTFGESEHAFSLPAITRLAFSHRNSLPFPRQLNATASTVQVPEASVASKRENLSEIDPAFYAMGYARSLRAYGIEFKEGIDGVGVYAAKDFPYSPKPRIIMEIPLELMISISKEPPWIFHPDFVPWGHPIFEIINSTDAEEDWDLRLACLLLLAMDTKDHFWKLYADFLPDVTECTSLLLAIQGELVELQHDEVTLTLQHQQQRVKDFWTKHWAPEAPLKIKRLARTLQQFTWAVAIAQTRHLTVNMTVGARPQVAHMFIPYIDMVNHSLNPTCSVRWRRKDRMLEVLFNGHQNVKAGTEMTLNYMPNARNEKFVEIFGLSSPMNEWEVLEFSGHARIHRDSFLSAFNIEGLSDGYSFNDLALKKGDTFLDGNLLAVARNLPFWWEKDLPFLPSAEKASVRDLQEECHKLLKAYPTKLERDLDLLENPRRRSRRWRLAVEYRVHRKTLIKKTIEALDLYLEKLLY